MRHVLTILALVSVLVLLGALKGAQISSLVRAGKAAEAAGPPPETVSTALATEQAWDSTIRAVGSVASSRGVELSNEVAGVVSRLHFTSGAFARRGQVLVTLESDVERASLESVRARRKLAELSLNRARRLVQAGAISQADVDEAESTLASLSAEEAALTAQIEQKVVRAPFSGKLGIRMVDVGQYLAPGTPITVLESTDTVFVDFTVPQQMLGRIRTGMQVRVSSSAGDAPLGEGTISAISPALDERTRSVEVRASMPRVEALRPGMFVDVAVVLPERRKVVTVPYTAVVHATFGDSVFIVETGRGPDGKPRKIARQKFVRVGEVRGDFAAIEQGVSPGQEVVSAGAFKLQNNAPIIVNNEVAPEPQLSPRPENG